MRLLWLFLCNSDANKDTEERYIRKPLGIRSEKNSKSFLVFFFKPKEIYVSRTANIAVCPVPVLPLLVWYFGPKIVLFKKANNEQFLSFFFLSFLKNQVND